MNAVLCLRHPEMAVTIATSTWTNRKRISDFRRKGHELLETEWNGPRVGLTPWLRARKIQPHFALAQ